MSKASKRRWCPAASHELSPAECGNGRISRYACPPACPFNPFAPANYDQLGELDAEALASTLIRLERETGHAARRERVERWAREGNRVALDAEAMWSEHGETDVGGRTFMERWAAEGFGHPRNDVRIVLERRSLVRPVLFEVQTIRDDRVVEGIDRLAPARPVFPIVDRGLGARAARFTTVFAYVYPLPHYERVLGLAIPMPSFHTMPPEETLREVVRHLGGSTEDPGFRLWSMRHFPRMVESFGAVGEVRRRIANGWARRTDLPQPGTEGGPANGRNLGPVPDNVPPRLLEDFPPPEFLRHFDVREPGGEAEASARRDCLREFPDRPLAFLGGDTPRAAAADPARRPHLLRLVKCLIRGCEEFSLRTGASVAIDDLVRELGLNEIQFPPPPVRARL